MGFLHPAVHLKGAPGWSTLEENVALSSDKWLFQSRVSIMWMNDPGLQSETTLMNETVCWRRPHSLLDF
ncbi:hypothetical protein LPU83_pLPU83b_0110 (plasmid) [Rhizobium favelukesii]|uniref:Uncharacterized protein n=1 Tax=Rhizobium favelukesii TaxID=348824 RepID=W6RH25_9HYPH|nr:hypothetical protein LPU83_pLPU83b_0110 [Rhizobium favelukesii]